MLNQRGQGLIEYLIIVALMAVATIGIMNLLNKTVRVQFGNVIQKLQGRDQVVQHQRLEDRDVERRSFSTFMNDR